MADNKHNAARKTPDQRRAAHALAAVRDINLDEQPEHASSYRSHCESLPAAILMNGLGQAMATELANADGEVYTTNNSKAAHRRLYDDLQNWLCQADPDLSPYESGNADDHLLQQILSHDQDLYLRAQAEAMAYLTWLKKFCQAKLPRSATQQGADDAPAT